MGKRIAIYGGEMGGVCAALKAAVFCPVLKCKKNIIFFDFFVVKSTSESLLYTKP